MWNQLCDDQHDAQTMKVINRAVMAIVCTFLTFGGVAIATRLGADAPPSSVAYGSQKAEKDVVVFGD